MKDEPKPTKLISVAMDFELYKDLKAIAQDKEASMKDIIQTCLYRYLKDFKNKDNAKGI